MNYYDLPENIREEYDNMKHQSLTLQTDVEQALNEAADLEDFISSVDSFMESISSEAGHVADTFKSELKKYNGGKT